jgi:hypothetical protein
MQANSTNTTVIDALLLHDISNMNLFRKGIASYVLIFLYVLSIVFGLFANFLVIYTIVRFRSMRNVTNVFVVNLAVCDLIVITICMPARIINEIDSQWYYGGAICKLNRYIQDVAVCGSILTLAFISCTRIYAVHYPLKVRSFLTKRRTYIFVLIIWVLVLIVSVPSLVFKKLKNININIMYEDFHYSALFASSVNITHQNETLINDRNDDMHRLISLKIKACIEDWGENNRVYKNTYFFFFFVAFYCLPLFIIFVNYGKIASKMLNYKLSYSHVVEPIGSNNSVQQSDEPIDTLSPWLHKGSTCNNSFRSQHSFISKHTNDPDCKTSASYKNSYLINCRKRFEQRRSICKMFVLISALFGMSWLPVHVINYLIEFNYDLDNMDLIYYYALFLGHLNSVINPICYTLMCDKFKQCFRKKQFHNKLSVKFK